MSVIDCDYLLADKDVLPEGVSVADYKEGQRTGGGIRGASARPAH